ncbi:DUF3267 domain-containing protein [Bacillus sp. 31A1R]|uniref:DUF3267 domain-containing protein n=1 Tax=Robertmurraya mangrovi TaxID=3098077 RepID=A0ABU5IST3_9BACI|nr:DUF3267 domain-containing protein [Bacillus sp. 31A1R]MDZ5470202.1 DUF3267 domain-containing protein [Bacillus sp. 31A1R]
MNCWKTINFSKQYGTERLFVLSSLTTLFAFILLYVPVTYLIIPKNFFYDNHFVFFLIGLFLLYPLHKILHFLPVAHLGKIVKKQFEFRLFIFPIINIKVCEPISKNLFIFALLMPFIIINAVLISTCFLLPHYAHYFTILIAFHTGLCVSDFICFKNILTAPRHSFIEENDEGFEILISRPS